MSFPISPLLSKDSQEDSKVADPALASLFDSGDWESAKSALTLALDPHGGGVLAGWENPASGHKGSFAAIGKAYPADDKICRVFLAKITREGDEQAMQGTACADGDGAWSISGSGPGKKA